MNSAKYDTYILNNVDMFIQIERRRGNYLIWQQDNAKIHVSQETHVTCGVVSD